MPEGTRTVLVVDDEPDIREIIRYYLEDIGYQVIEADRAEQAIVLAQQHRPALITLDIMMPGMDGLEASKRLKENPLTRDIPIMILSIVADKSRCLQGIADFLSKPFERDDLLNKVRTILTETTSPLPGGQRRGAAEPKNILIVDDDPDTVAVIRYWLEEASYNCATAFDGLQALDMTRSQTPDLILTDIKMPGMDGYEIIKRLKSRPETARVPIVILTAVMITQADRNTGLQLGASRFLTKPFEPSALLAEIQQVLAATPERTP